MNFSFSRLRFLQHFLTLSMPNLQGGFGSFLTSSVARFEKKFAKMLELILSSKQYCPSFFRQIFEAVSCLNGSSSDFRLFHDSLACQYFHLVCQQHNVSLSFYQRQNIIASFLKLKWSVGLLVNERRYSDII